MCLQVWMLILRYFAGIMVWLTIIAVNLGLTGCTLYAYNMAGMLSATGKWGAAVAAQLPAGTDPTGGLCHITLQAWHAWCPGKPLSSESDDCMRRCYMQQECQVGYCQ
jgi:hypothetical protein